ncbi:MAG: cell division protein FtsA, partial [Candidatus Magasanikbacteria bacterium CG10_big_fil_rev_8_21_14_0_10_43_6]
MMRKKEHTELITGLDIGTTAVRIAVGQYLRSEGQDKMQIIGAVEVPSEGMQKGVITSIEDTVSAVSNALEQAERLIGIPIEHVWVGISGVQIISQESRGVIAVGRSDGEISDDDVERAVEAARTVAGPLNYEVIH